MRVFFWPDGTWCFEEDFNYYRLFMSDDYGILNDVDDLTDCDIEKLVDQSNSFLREEKSPLTPFGEAIKARDEYLKSHPHLQEFQKEIDRVLDATPEEKRSEVLGIWISSKLMEIKTTTDNFSRLLSGLGAKEK